ncbi:XRE family transcriptional regulator [Falsiroseomonas bella]|uniref:XRE family transcriptional regulator n=1 Tax=Falsiroseomonas bella TaxID=2184016 RepID=A0A317F8T3_9PROT|nr:helix-turn-helix transcriptional regulator [Falsiroseomonas bella]PWS35175.1 XRE family transcriptional regulator [Falsiroseomonas bella]
MSFGAIIRERRIALAIGLVDMSERLGISAPYLSRIERGLESPPRDELIERAAAILGLQMDDLFVKARRLPPDMRDDMEKVVRAYRRLRAIGER